MKKGFIKLLAVIMVAAMAFAACGKKTDTEDEGNNQGTDAAPVTLVFWSVGLKLKDDSGVKSPEELAANIYIKKFEDAHPGVTVEVVDQPTDQIQDLFKAANLTEEGPDVIGLWSGSATNVFKDDLLSLDDYMTEEEFADYTGLNLCKEDFKADGAVKALPYNLTTYNIFYNKEYFAQAGIPSDQLPKTWDEFLAVCDKLKAAGIQPLLIGDSSGESTAWITSEFMADLVGPDKIVEFGTDALPFASDEYRQTLTTWSNLFTKDYTNKDMASLAAWDSIQRFVTGEGAMNINGSWAIGEMQPIMQDNLGTFKIPAITADAPYGDYIISQPGANVSVTAYSKNKELAVELIKFMTSAEFEAAAHADTGDLPANNKADSSVISNPISQASYSWIQENKAVIGYDSLIPIGAVNELYKIAPTLDKGSLTVDDFIAKLETASK